MVTWRLAGFDTRGQDLELSELQLWSSTAQLDASAVVTSSHAPLQGSIAELRDGDLQTTCRWRASDVSSPGFYIQWETNDVPTRIKVAAGGDADAHLHACHLQVLQGGRWLKQRAYEGLQPQGLNTWYATAPLARYVAHTEDVVVTASTVTCLIPESVIAGHLLFAAIMHRSVLTVPSGWTVAVAVPTALSDTGSPQYLTVLMREATAADAGASMTFVQASSVRFITGILAIDTGGSAVDLHAVVRVDQITQPAGPEFPQVSPTLELLESDFGLFGVATYYYSTATTSETSGAFLPWTVLPPTTGVLGITPALLQSEQRRLIASYIEGVSGTFGSTQYNPSTVEANQTHSYFSLRIRPSSPRLLTRGRSMSFGRTDGYRVATGEQVLAQGVLNTTGVETSQVLDKEFGGHHRIHGSVKRKSEPTNTPLRRRVRLHRSRDGMLVRETWSKADGTYEFLHITDRYEYDTIAWDHEMQQRSVIANNLKPEPM